MYTIDENDRVVGLDTLPQSDVGAPRPFIFSNEFRVLLAYFIQESDPDLIRLHASLKFEFSNTEPIAVINFLSPKSHIFGPPNDEAFSGHPLASRGLRPYGAYIVENSSWIRGLEKMNSVHPMHNPETFVKYHHYIFTFHDSTFECIAKSFTVSVHKMALEEVHAKMVSMLG